MKEYRCTRNALYQHECTGKYDLRERQGYYIHAHSEEEAWQKMATRFPDETEAGFSVQEWESFNVQVMEVQRDDQDNIIHDPVSNKPGYDFEAEDTIGTHDPDDSNNPTPN